MKLLGAIFLSFFLSNFSIAAETICLQTFNVYAPAYASGISQRLSSTAMALTQDPCDVMQFQELWKDSQDSLLQTKMVSLGMRFLRADNLRRDKAIIGLSTAIKGDVNQAFSQVYKVNNEKGFLDWVRELSGVQKGFTAIESRLESVGGQEMLLINTHTHPDNTAIRAAQMIQLIDYYYHSYRGPAGAPIFFTADLNATPDSIEINLMKKVLFLRDAYLEVNKEYGKVCTYCAANPLSWSQEDRVIDYTLFRSGTNLRLQPAASMINLQGADSNNPLSDHYGVRSLFSFEVIDSGLLDANHPLVLKRRDEAALALSQAIDLMRGEENKVYDRSIIQAQTLLAEFSAGGVLSPNADLATRLPE